MNATPALRTKKVEHLTDGEEFSLDGGTTWHTCAVVLFGNVAVYTSDDRDPDNAPTTRIDAARDQTVHVR